MTNQLLIATDRWRHDHAGSRAAGVAYRGVVAAAQSDGLAAMKRDLEASLRDRWGTATKQELLADPVLAAYQAYDQRFGQNYHVAMQIRSIAQHGKAIPDRNPLIEAMFMTELKTGVLAAAQDSDAIRLPITIDSAQGTEAYVRYDGVAERCRPGDQVMIDADGNVLTSIAQGPTAFGLVGPATSAVCYCFYFPVGVDDAVIEEALAYLDVAVRTACPGAQQTGTEIVASD
jgi:DNA/RNA-binding domain of Phe-tRNA-synthetase-like protein